MDPISHLCFAHSGILKNLAEYFSSSSIHTSPKWQWRSADPQPTGDLWPERSDAVVQPRNSITKTRRPKQKAQSRVVLLSSFSILTVPGPNLGSFLPRRIKLSGGHPPLYSSRRRNPPPSPSRLPVAPTHHEGQQQLAEGSTQGAPGPCGVHLGAGLDADSESPRRCGGAGGEFLAAVRLCRLGLS